MKGFVEIYTAHIYIHLYIYDILYILIYIIVYIIILYFEYNITSFQFCVDLNFEYWEYSKFKTEILGNYIAL